MRRLVLPVSARGPLAAARVAARVPTESTPPLLLGRCGLTWEDKLVMAEWVESGDRLIWPDRPPPQIVVFVYQQRAPVH